jgi:hypothetical protein
MDPLVIFCRIGKFVDSGLVDQQPVADADFFTHQRLQGVYVFDDLHGILLSRALKSR